MANLTEERELLKDSSCVVQNSLPVKKKTFLNRPVGSVVGLIEAVAIGFALYFLLSSIKISGPLMDYNTVIENVNNVFLNKILWTLMNFTEPQFYAGVVSSIAIILGGVIAWRLDLKNSKYAGFNVCYGANMFPWVLASQVLSLSLTMFVFNYTDLFNSGNYTWLPTFITVVGLPPALMLIYGPSLKALLTGSILASLMSFPIALWISDNIIPVLGVPGVVSNVFTMAITEIIIFQICKVLPWMEKVQPKAINRTPKDPEDEEEAMKKPLWFLRRVAADFSEAQFYGNEIAGLMVIVGVTIDWLLNFNHGVYGSGVIPAILLSQIVASAVGVFLYFDKFRKGGWYATYVPVVSVGPACVLMFGGTIPVALVSGVLGGIIGAPVAEYFARKVPEDFHTTIANVTSMGVSTIVVSMVIKALPWF
ncbi:hypothetical protein [Clostridium polynesiense]|uniref:hypothetical protein n=1 Tax=Clostridium polynesiense TaxID=1325933 RepID=UPI000A6389F5|nr:hypothetical protein [Clostridium polynesiense]